MKSQIVLHILGLGGSFYLGMAIMMLLKAQASISARSNSIDSLKEYFRTNRVLMLARVFTATILLPLIIKGIPSAVTDALPPISVYGVAGLASDALLNPILFMLGQKLGNQSLAKEMPEVAPPMNPPQPPPPQS